MNVTVIVVSGYWFFITSFFSLSLDCLPFTCIGRMVLNLLHLSSRFSSVCLDAKGAPCDTLSCKLFEGFHCALWSSAGNSFLFPPLLAVVVNAIYLLMPMKHLVS